MPGLGVETEAIARMDGLGTKVSAKIRLAIKSKLIKLEAYVDDELPDYIMVMLANHKTRTQMERDLGFFLKNNTAAFTNWLFAVIERLKKVTFEEVTKNEVKKNKVSQKPAKKVKDGREKSRRSSDRLERSSATSRASQKERKSSSCRPSQPSPPKDVPVSKDDVNMAELGQMKRKKKISTGELGGSHEAEGYNPTSLLKSALDKANENKGKSLNNRRSSSFIREPSKRAKEDKEVERNKKKESSSEVKRSKSRVKDDKEKKTRPKAIMKEEVEFFARDSRTRNHSGGGSPQQSEVCQKCRFCQP